MNQIITIAAILALSGCASQPTMTPKQESSCELDASMVHQSNPAISIEQHMAVCKRQTLGI